MHAITALSAARRFFSPPEDGAAAGLFGVAHVAFLFFTLLSIALALYAARGIDERRVRRIIRVLTLILWALEAVKIAFVLFAGDFRIGYP